MILVNSKNFCYFVPNNLKLIEHVTNLIYA